MSVNNYEPHVMVLPEDDANRQLAVGFVSAVDQAHARQIQVLAVAGGWANVLDSFESDHASRMTANQHRHMVLLIDFDGRNDRLNRAKTVIPERLINRVFVLGAWTDPEALRASLGSYETIGRAMAKDCREETDGTWGHHLLRHNASELDRLRERVRPILFQPI